MSDMHRLGDPRTDDQPGWTLLPVDTSDGQCSQCGRQHEPEQPHDNQSLHYQYAFYAEHGQWPTWGDAMAHCAPDVQQFWTERLNELGVSW